MNLNHLAITLFSSLTVSISPVVADEIKLACVGDSITRGVGAKKNPYPKQLQEMLGEDWKVMNFGFSGATLMNSGNKPYQSVRKFKDAMASEPDIVVIMLGTNDTKPNNWKKFESDYEKDLRDLIGDFASLESKPRIFLCFPPYIAGDGNWGINETNTQAQIPVIARIAEELNLKTIDVHAALDGKDEVIPDGVHPNEEGAELIAKAVHAVLSKEAVPMVESKSE